MYKGEVFFFQAEDGIRDLVRSRGLGDVYKRQVFCIRKFPAHPKQEHVAFFHTDSPGGDDGVLLFLSLIHI